MAESHDVTIILLFGLLAYIFLRLREYKVNLLLFFIIYLIPTNVLYIDVGFHLYYHRILMIVYLFYFLVRMATLPSKVLSEIFNSTTLTATLFLFLTLSGLGVCINYTFFFHWWILLLSGILLCLFILEQIQDIKRLEGLIFTCIISGFTWSIAGLLLFVIANTTLSNIEINQIYRLKGLSIDSNFFATILIGWIQLSLFWFIKKESQDTVVNLMALFTMIIALIFTYSRGGYLGFLSIFLLDIICFLRFSRKYSHLINFKKLMFFLGTFIILLIVFLVNFNTISNRIVSIKTEKRLGAGRIYAWKDALSVVKKNPFGVGLKNYKAYTMKHRSEYQTAGSDVHNAFLHILAETGVFAFLVYVFFLGTIVSKIRYASVINEYHLFHWFSGIFIAFIGIMACSFFISNPYSPIVFINIGLFLGTYNLYQRGNREDLKGALPIC